VRNDRTDVDSFLSDVSPGGAPARAAPNPLHIVHRCLRGRYLLASILAAVLMVPGALLGYTSVPPLYESSSLLQISPTLSVTVYPTEESGVPAMYQSFVAAQAAFLSERRVVDAASRNERVAATGWPAWPEGATKLASRLSVQTGRNDQIIRVTVAAEEPAQAEALVNAVMDSYVELYGEQSGLRLTAKQRDVQALAGAKKMELSQIEQSIMFLAREYGTDELDAKVEAKSQELFDIQRKLGVIEHQILEMEASQGKSVAEGEDAPVELSVEILAQQDPELRARLQIRNQLESELGILGQQVSPAHRRYVELKRRLDEVDRQVQERAAQVRAEGAQGGVRTAAGGVLTLAQLKELRDTTSAWRDRVAREAAELTDQKAQLDKQKNLAEQAKAQYDTFQSRIEELRVEEGNLRAGRVRIAARGEKPLAATKDRRIPLAIAGALAGAGLAFVGVGLVGLLTRGYGYVDDADQNDAGLPLLGTLPDLSADNPEGEELAALSVHHIRNMLDIRSGERPRNGARVWTVTSGAAGDGKTSLALALGMSFSVAGHRTALVDADLVGRGLTRQLGLKGRPGLIDAVTARRLNGELHRIRPDLDALPAGAAEEFFPETLSSERLRGLVAELRDRYEVVVVDTGPVLGSLEANLVAKLSDGVVLCVARGQTPRLVKAAAERLRSIGADCVGMVFNRAMASDLRRSVSHASVSSQSVRSLRGAKQTVRPDHTSGALVRVVEARPRPQADAPIDEEPASSRSSH
jgi:Mrp family chromosome partitioning ATPase/uncharacterized protein involved in exopolysaccharide biosynthesis